MSDTNSIPQIEVKSNTRSAWLLAILGGLVTTLGIGLCFMLAFNLLPNQGGFLSPLIFCASGAVILFGSIRFIRNPPVLLTLNQEGLYVAEFKQLFPWSAIETSTLTTLGNRMSQGDRLVAAIMSRNSTEQTLFLVVSFSDIGLKKFGSKIYARMGLNKYMTERERLGISLASFDFGSAASKLQSADELVNAVNRCAGFFGAKKSVSAGSKGQKEPSAIKSHSSDSPPADSSSLEPLSGLSAAIVTVGMFFMGFVITLMKFGSRQIGRQQLPNSAGSLFAMALIGLAMFGIVVTPIMIVRGLPGFFEFLMGSPRYRAKWTRLQILAWVLMLCYTTLVAMAWLFAAGKDLSEALTISLINSVPAGIGFYLIVMSMMPTDFFVEDYMGQRVLKFLGCKTPASGRPVCVLSALLLFGISLGLNYIVYTTFRR